MSTLACRLTSDEEIFNHCQTECGIVTCNNDMEEPYFALKCMFCSEKFLHFQYFMRHIQSEHYSEDVFTNTGIDGGRRNGRQRKEHISHPNSAQNRDRSFSETAETEEILPNIFHVKQELPDEENSPQQGNDDLPFFHESDLPDIFIKPEIQDSESMDAEDHIFPHVADEMSGEMQMGDAAGSITSYNGSEVEDDDDGNYMNDSESNYDDMVEQSLLGGANAVRTTGVVNDDSASSSGELALHIKDRKMIQFVIDQYRSHPFLWDHLHPRFRDRRKRQTFVDWMILEFKRRFNVALARDAITRKWDNLRTVYKRECNRMSMEKTNVSTLWYFKELNFLNRLYPNNEKMKETVVQETVGKRRLTALWNDVSTTKLLTMLRKHPSFYDKSSPDYRSKEKRGEALNAMASELQKYADISAIQISKRISQLRFDYSRQKQERLQCEQNQISFVPTYSYYEQMNFMDDDIAPFKCDFCPTILQTTRDLEAHSVLHQGPNLKSFRCPVCRTCFPDIDQYNRHKLEAHAGRISTPPSTPKAQLTSVAAAPSKDQRFNCDLCTASFRERSNYEEHMRRHNEELLLPGLADVDFSSAPKVVASEASTQRACICDICGKSFHSSNLLITHRAMHSSERNFKCDYPECGRAFPAQRDLVEHCQQMHFNRKYKCETCHKYFKSSKNLHNHRALHDNVKRFVCKVCGSRFAQPAGLYLHKRKYNHDFRGSHNPSVSGRNSTSVNSASETMQRSSASDVGGSAYDGGNVRMQNHLQYSKNLYNSNDYNY